MAKRIRQLHLSELLTEKKNIFFLSAFMLFVTSWVSTGFHQIDEHFQILEFAGLKLGLTVPSELPWEFFERMRPAIQPTIVVLVYKILSWIGLQNPFYVSTFLRVLSGALSFWAMIRFYQVTFDRFQGQELKRWYLYLSFLSWFLFYNHVRFSSENWAGIFFVLGFSEFFSTGGEGAKKCFFSGLFLGLAFLFRYQVGLLIAGFGLWLIFVRRVRFVRLLPLVLGFLAAFGLGMLIDRWFYGQWVVTSWNYFAQNIIQNRVSHFGKEPWWWYFKKTFEQGIPPFGLCFPLALGVYFFREKTDALTWALVPFLLVHFLIGHKEMRFLYPIIGFLPLLLTYLVGWFFEKNIGIKFNLVSRVFRVYFLLNLGLCLFVMLTPAKGDIALFKFIYDHYPNATVVNTIKRNPYFQVFNFRFYSRKNLEVKKVDRVQEIPVDSKVTELLSVGIYEPRTEIEKKYPLVYSTYPRWLHWLSSKGWVSLGDANFVYQLN